MSSRELDIVGTLANGPMGAVTSESWAKATVTRSSLAVADWRLLIGGCQDFPTAQSALKSFLH